MKIHETDHLPNGLLTLLRSIAREIDERCAETKRLDALVEALSIAPHVHGDEIANLQAESASHKRELRYAVSELEDLGCEVEGMAPVTIRFSVDGVKRRASFTFARATKRRPEPMSL